MPVSDRGRASGYGYGLLELSIIASNMETNGAITAKRAYVSRFRIFHVHLMVFHAT
jgi:hypothetical protein